MPTIQEIEEIKQAHMQSMLQAKARFEIMQANTAAARLSSSAALSVSPFGVGQESQQVRMFTDSTGPVPRTSEALQTGTIALEALDGSATPEANLLVSGIILVAICVFLLMLLRR